MSDNYFRVILLAIAEPLKLVLQALGKLIGAVLTAVVGVPTQTLHVLTQRLAERTNGMDASLDARTAAKKKRAADKRLDAALEQLYYSGDFILHTRQAKKVKNLLVLLLEIVSFVTTYRGLVQVTSALHFAVPLLWAVVIQTGLTFLASTANSECAGCGRKVLLAIFLAVSLMFSYIGVAENMVPYSEYAEKGYTEFAHVWEDVRTQTQHLVETGSNPVAELEGQYMVVDQLLADGRERYSDTVLSEAEARLNEYKGMTVPVTVERPVYTYYDENGNLIRNGGGTVVEYVSDPDAKAFIQAEEENIRFLEEQRALIREIETLLTGSGSQAAVRSALEAQLAAPETVLPEFTTACSTARVLMQKCSQLARGMDSGLKVEIDLYAILNGFRNSDRLLAQKEITPFRTIYGQWQETEFAPAESGIGWLDETLAVLTANDPARLKTLVDQSVTGGYNSLRASLDYVGAQAQTEQLRKAYENYHLDPPVSYAVGGLRPSDEKFQTCILAAFCALCNDGLAVMIGFLLERKKVFWATNKTLTRAELMPHLFPHFRSIVLPEIRKRIEGEVTFDRVRDAFAEILLDYLDAFALAPQLVAEGFTRCRKMSGEDREMDAFFAFLLTRELAKTVTAEETVILGVAKDADDGYGYLLLTSRAEGWLTELLGSASELGYHDLALSA